MILAVIFRTLAGMLSIPVDFEVSILRLMSNTSAKCPMDIFKYPMDIQMSIRRLDQQKCPLDIQTSISPLDQLKCSIRPLDISVRPIDEWTFECLLDISVRPMDEWTFECPLDVCVHSTNGHFFISNEHVTFYNAMQGSCNNVT